MNNHLWVFISPHFDDIALSCGGMVWDLSQHSQTIEIWTIMGGFPPDENYSDFAVQVQAEWGISGEAAVNQRRAEDIAACQVLGVSARHFDWPDAIYRRYSETGKTVVNNSQELLGNSPEETLVIEIAAMLQTEIPEDALVVLPMSLGNHIDHRAVAQAGQFLSRKILYYADYPYIIDSFDQLNAQRAQWHQQSHLLTPDALGAWQEAVLCYTSQRSTFWRDEAEARLALRNYLAGGGGRLWQKVISQDSKDNMNPN